MTGNRIGLAPGPLQACRAALLEAGVDVTPEGLGKVIHYSGEIAGVLATKQVTLELNEQTKLKVDLQARTASVIHSKEESA